MEGEAPENSEVEPARRPAKLIKRYANRKLYDTSESRYVTLEEIGEMVRQGLEVEVIDNRSKGDRTAVTLAQIIFEEEKKRNRMPLAVLRDIIRNGGETLHGLPQSAREPHEIPGRLGEIEQRIDHLAEAPAVESGALPQAYDGAPPEKHESH